MMKPGRSRTAELCWNASRRLLISSAAALSVAVFPAVLLAAPSGIGLSVAPTYPSVVQVGQNNLAVSITITNGSTTPEDTGQVTLSNIFHTPACDSTAVSVCLPGNEEPGVFFVHGPISGTDGSVTQDTYPGT